MDQGVVVEEYNSSGGDEAHQFSLCKTWRPGDPQQSSDLYVMFSKNYGFEQVTSSPHYPQGNGEAERAIMGLLCKSGDPYLSQLAYR